MRKKIMLAPLSALAAIATPGAADETRENPLVAPWTGLYGGVPAWDKVTLDDSPARSRR